ncbi:hypothetical protein ILUMI_14566 [Ignelater luminosus]|uniref:Transposable element P transposase n=1 Tax=Ignelater luminosus TaxID=2038154 RepID=A0A8K0CWB9_IGNLU|nr:hypothetical protein ILUMI_14566 [Ignelater luminosus]
MKYIEDFEEKGYWKPIQTGIILSTQTILDLQDYFLNKRNYKFLYTSRLSQDCLENMFGQIRSKQDIPDALQFRILLKNLCIVQYLEVNNTTIIK